MPILEMKKILIGGHLSEYQDFLKNLQYASILQITGSSQSSANKITEPHGKSPINPETFQRLEEMYLFLKMQTEKGSFIQNMTEQKPAIDRDVYEDIEKSFNPDSFLKNLTELKEKIKSLQAEKKAIIDQNNKYLLWKNIDLPLHETGNLNKVDIVTGSIFTRALPSIKKISMVEISELAKITHKSLIIIAFLKEDKTKAMAYLTKHGFSEISFAHLQKSPQKMFKENEEKLEKIDNEIEKLTQKTKTYNSFLVRLETYLEYAANNRERYQIARELFTTQNAFFLEGWILNRDLAILTRISDSHQTIVFQEIIPAKGEKPPVYLDNVFLFKPFQLITRLYSLPAYHSMDPSVVSSFFFLIFFSIALSDAGYGLILAAISIFFLKKSTKTKDLFWLGLWAGIFTTIAGLLTGGILGDLFRLENPFIDWKTVSLFREKLLWFDPMKEPMIFFRLVLFLGFFQIATGLALGLWINLRKKNFLAALADNLSWLLIIFSLSLLLFSSDYCVRMSLISGTKPPLDPSHQGLAFYVISFMAVIIILFSARDEKSLFFRIFLGFLKLLVLSGFFSFLGDILSYIRLMALGMVSAGIAMAINTIAFMAWNLPYLGILFTLLILVIGHIFNLGINVLGAFVHSVRLVYVEFFPKFFVGGGKKFSPLANSNKFIEIIQ